MGRAMLMPIFKQVRKASSEIDEELEKALLWWLAVLQESICEIRWGLLYCDTLQDIVSHGCIFRQWHESEQQPVQLLCDARSTPPRIAAVPCMRYICLRCGPQVACAIFA